MQLGGMCVNITNVKTLPRFRKMCFNKRIHIDSSKRNTKTKQTVSFVDIKLWKIRKIE